MKTNEPNNYQHIKALNKAYLKKQLVIFYGAGISKPLGLPSWSELISGVLKRNGGDDYGKTQDLHY